MADDENKVEEQDDEKQPEPSADQEEGKQEKDEWWAKAQERGFKSKEDLWKSYREAEKKISQMGEEVKKSKYFQEQVTPVLEAVWKDDVILNRIRSQAGFGASDGEQSQSNDNQNQPPRQTQRSQQPSVDPEARTALFAQTVQKFESDKGLDNLDEETQQDVRAKLGKQAAKWVGDLRNVPPSQLSSLLEDAYDVLKTRDESLKKMTSDASSNKGQDVGAMPSASSGSGSEKDGDVKLSPEQIKVAERMGGIEVYKKGLKKLMGK